MTPIQTGTSHRDKRDKHGTNGTKQSAANGTNGTHTFRCVPLSRATVPVLSVPPERDKLTALAARVLRLCPSHRDPEAFFVEKSELAGELRRLARAMGAAR